MKQVKLFLASALLIVSAAGFAQDTTKVTDEAAKQREGPGLGAQKQSEDYRKDMTIIQPVELPGTLRKTLEAKQYEGWEKKSTIYRSKGNDSFIVEMRDGDQVNVHRFDQYGKPVKDYD